MRTIPHNSSLGEGAMNCLFCVFSIRDSSPAGEPEHGTEAPPALHSLPCSSSPVLNAPPRKKAP